MQADCTDASFESKPMSRYARWILIGVGLVAYAAIGTYVDPLVLSVLVAGFLVFVALPCVLIALGILLVALGRRRPLPLPRLILARALTFALLVGLVVPIGWLMQARAVAAAKDYPERVAPLLENYRRMHGAYPPTLDQLPTKPSVPRLLRTPSGYRSHEYYYRFHFSDPGDVMGAWDYESGSAKWNRSD